MRAPEKMKPSKQQLYLGGRAYMHLNKGDKLWRERTELRRRVRASGNGELWEGKHTGEINCLRAQSLQLVIRLFETSWTIVPHALLSLTFPGKNTGAGCHSPPPEVNGK